MKIIILLTVILAANLFACEVSVLNSCREDTSKLVSMRKFKRSYKKISKDQILSESIISQFSKLTHRDSHAVLFKSLLDIEQNRERFKVCKRNFELYYEDENGTQTCLALTLKDQIRFALVEGLLDNTAYLILESKLENNNKSAFTGDLSSYANKIRLLRASYLRHNPNAIFKGEQSPLNMRRYKKRLGKLRSLTPRQGTLLKYNYSQIKFMGKLMQKFEARYNSQVAGLYFDYDGDGINDENQILDPADKYRMSVKLLKLELEKLSFSGEIFADLKPDFHDLLVASNELGLVLDEDLKEMIELPFLYEKKTPVWKKALNISWAVGKGVIMAIPGVNLYSIIPIVLVDSFISQKERADETSDLHLFTF